MAMSKAEFDKIMNGFDSTSESSRVKNRIPTMEDIGLVNETQQTADEMQQTQKLQLGERIRARSQQPLEATRGEGIRAPQKTTSPIAVDTAEGVADFLGGNKIANAIRTGYLRGTQGKNLYDEAQKYRGNKLADLPPYNPFSKETQDFVRGALPEPSRGQVAADTATVALSVLEPGLGSIEKKVGTSAAKGFLGGKFGRTTTRFGEGAAYGALESERQGSDIGTGATLGGGINVLGGPIFGLAGRLIKKATPEERIITQANKLRTKMSENKEAALRILSPGGNDTFNLGGYGDELDFSRAQTAIEKNVEAIQRGAKDTQAVGENLDIIIGNTDNRITQIKKAQEKSLLAHGNNTIELNDLGDALDEMYEKEAAKPQADKEFLSMLQTAKEDAYNNTSERAENFVIDVNTLNKDVSAFNKNLSQFYDSLGPGGDTGKAKSKIAQRRVSDVYREVVDKNLPAEIKYREKQQEIASLIDAKGLMNSRRLRLGKKVTEAGVIERGAQFARRAALLGPVAGTAAGIVLEGGFAGAAAGGAAGASGMFALGLLLEKIEKTQRTKRGMTSLDLGKIKEFKDFVAKIPEKKRQELINRISSNTGLEKLPLSGFIDGVVQTGKHLTIRGALQQEEIKNLNSN